MGVGVGRHYSTFYVVFAIGLTAVLISLLVEGHRHRGRLARVPVRIVINGIRGKSSITRLVAGSLRGQLPTVAKTTGTAARFIFADGHEVPFERRFGLANIIEQVDVVADAAKAGARALVIECMAVNPDLQQLNQEKLIQATIVVISNVREDHLDVMGPTLDDVARSLCRSMPAGGVCVTAERDRLHILRAEADRRNCSLVVADPESVSDREMAGFGWVTFKENVAVALAVADLMGVPRADALAGMYRADPDPGVLRVDRCEHAGHSFLAANLFAANDPESTLMNLELLQNTGQLPGSLSMVINCRPDRIERNGQMGHIVAKIGPERVYLIGTPTRSALRTIPSELRHRVVDLGGEHRSGTQLLSAITAQMPRDDHGLVMVGNIHGRGEHLLDALIGGATRPAVDDPALLPRVRLEPAVEPPSLSGAN
ncbi:poly-gamma-glutamate synthase PgsB [Rugosimonospora africana]|uniref:Poly-gamma-glutamate synthase PgsB n=1 Tax=Rugosimonospora africana TaxID=556532 RepID=A0A8J3QS15_9ACTN|nr:poly-gamma-glutamate synthase PgsB [Rugosimonospora africana]GIH14061.1 poly-gamma-glutamate synthase PgsB [Rugosimonospora africana]